MMCYPQSTKNINQCWVNQKFKNLNKMNKSVESLLKTLSLRKLKREIGNRQQKLKHTQALT
jgi:hypothetical protein